MKRFTVGALIGVFVVWASGAVWNWGEQTRLAETLGFEMPWLLPFMLDGLALSLAAVATAASLDGRAGVVSRVGTVVAIILSSAASGYAAHIRTESQNPFTGDMIIDPVAIAIGAGAPIVALIAFEVLLTEVRRMVQKARGRKSPVPIPYPRLIRWILAPWRTFFTWRRIVLDLTNRELMVVEAAVAAMPVVVTSVEVESIPAPAAPARSATLAPRPPRPVLTNVELDAERRAAARSIVVQHAEGDPHKISRDDLAARIRAFDTGNGHRLSCPNAVASEILNSMREEYVP